MKHLCLVVALCGALASSACEQEAADAPAPQAPKVSRVASTDGVVSVMMPPELVVHRFDGAVQGVTGDGAYRLHVERLAPDKLIRLAATAKDAWTARGWEVTGEQHFERALSVAMRRGGVPRQPRERREVWWVEGRGAVSLCDVIVKRSAFHRLGEPVEVGCKTIEVEPWPDPQE